MVASRLYRTSTDSGLQRWLTHCAPAIRELGLILHAVGPLAEALSPHPLLAGNPACSGCYPTGRDGGLVRLASHFVAEPPSKALTLPTNTTPTFS
jgi:methylglyoxal synthase